MTPNSEPTAPVAFVAWLDQQPEKARKRLGEVRKQLLQLFKKPQRDSVLWQHAVGQCLLKLFPPDDQRRGHSFMEAIGDLVQPGRDRAAKSIITALYQWRSLAMRCSRREIADLAAKVRAGTITPLKVTYLVSVTPENNTRTRAEFLRDCISQDWSANQLRHEIESDRRHLTSFGGRHPRPRTSSSPAIAVREIIVLARTWTACHEQYFQRRGGPLAKTPTKCSPRLLRELEAALGELGQVARQAATARKILKPIVEKLQAKLSAGANGRQR